MTSILLFICIPTSFVSIGQNGVTTNLPRYSFQAGQQLLGKGTHKIILKNDGTPREAIDETEWKAWVIRTHPNGTFRVFIRDVTQNYSLKDGKPEDKTTRTRVAFADLQPDGAYEENPTTEGWDPVSNFLPRLPKNEKEIREGWTSWSDGIPFFTRSIDMGAWETRRIKDEGKPNSGTFIRTNRINTTNRQKGPLVSSEVQFTMEGQPDANGTGTLETTVSQALPGPEWKQLVADSDRYAEAVLEYDRAQTRAIRLSLIDATTLVNKAGKSLEQVANTVTQIDLKTDLVQLKEKHANTRAMVLSQVQSRTKVIDKEAFLFSGNDLNGKPLNLRDLRGKVVVLDFWYKGCGWCIKAMPQVKKLAEEFQNQPVVVIGVSVDANDKDAKSVVNRLNLAYPIIRLEPQILEKYGVQGMPSLLVIDKQGIVRDLHVGYSATLKEEVSAMVRSLIP